MSDVWMVCSACRKEIHFGKVYWVCSVSTCNRNRTRLVFCSVACWDSHVAILRHRDAWAVEERAPSRAEWEAREPDEAPDAAPASTAPRRVVAPPPAPSPASSSNPALSSNVERDILIVMSKMKK